MHPEFLKFDMALIRSVHLAAGERQRLVASLVQMARDVGATPLAEGIESEESDACLRLGFELAGLLFRAAGSLDGNIVEHLRTIRPEALMAQSAPQDHPFLRALTQPGPAGCGIGPENCARTSRRPPAYRRRVLPGDPPTDELLVLERLGNAAGLFIALRCKQPAAASHGLRVALLCSAWPGRWTPRRTDRSQIEVAALLHDLGIIGVPDRILQERKLALTKSASWSTRRLGQEILRASGAAPTSWRSSKTCRSGTTASQRRRARGPQNPSQRE